MDHTQIIEIIKEFDGVIGAIIGAVAGTIGTLITTHILKTKGKINVRLIKSNIKFYSHRDGFYNEELPLDEADGMIIQFELELFNNSETSKYLNDFKVLLFDDNGNVILERDVNSEESKRVASGRVIYDSITHINLEPKILVKQGIYCSFRFSDHKNAKNYKKIIFRYTDNKSKAHSIIVEII